jgi:hypothetical protein
MKTRKRPAPPRNGNRPSLNNPNTVEITAHRPQDGYAAPSPEDRADLAVLAAAEALGYRIAIRCLDCGHWLSSPASVAAHRGPRCRARRGGD